MMKLLITKRLTALLWALVLTLMPMSLMADNTPLSVTVTSEGGSFANEQAGNAFDGITTNKWCGGKLALSGANAYVQVRLAEKSKLDYYYLYTGNDINYKDDDSQQQRNPKEWKLYAKVNEGDEWTLISHVTDAGLPTTVSTRSKNYKIDAAYQNIEYNYLKFEILQIEKGDIFEVGEICFIKCNHTFGSDDICTECGYEKQQDDGFINVATASQMYNVLSGNAHAKVRLTQDIYMSDLGEGESGRHTLCSTFSGTLDGNGHTIWAARPEVTHNSTGHYHRQYLFTYSDGATFKNLTFKNFRVQSVDHHNQAIITSQAKNGCVFENITFDHISTYVGDSHDNTGAVVGYATTNCTFRNITVKNSDFTANRNQAGAVVGHAMNCTFTDIKVENCESTARTSYTGGVAGRTDDCTISDVEILGTLIKTVEQYGGGVVGYSTNTHFTNCVVDDQSCVLVGGVNDGAHAGGITGYGKKTTISNCINSALIAADHWDAGGIVGNNENSNIVGCLNTGMVIGIPMDDVEKGFYTKYKTKTDMTYVTKTYQGKEYAIRKYEGGSFNKSMDGFHNNYGGIAGYMPDGNVSKCVNLGSIYCTSESKEAGGIAGRINKGTISDCLSDFSGDGYGICQFRGGNGISVNNCLNMTTYKDISAFNNLWGDFKGEHNYSLTTAEDAHHTNKTTAAKIKSGEICLLLGENWEQNLGTDAYPTPTGNKGVYHTRKVSDQYGTVCLPFAVKSDDKISYYTLNAEKVEGQDIKLVFKYVEENQPGFPVLFRAAEAKDADAENPVDIYFSNAGDAFTRDPKSDFSVEHWALYGTFKQEVYDDNPYALISSKTIYYISGGEIRNAKKVIIAPYCAWFLGPNIDTLTGKTIRFEIEGEGGETTALELVGEDLKPVLNGKAYSIMGTEVDESYRGIVIKNGKKVVIK